MSGVYTTGYTAGPAHFGTNVEAGVVDSAGGYDVSYVAMQTNNGNLQTAAGFGDPSDQYGYAIAADAIGMTGHVALAGPYAGSITFSGTPPLTSAGLHDMFVAKAEIGGPWQWSVSIGDPQEQVAYGTAIDSAGNVVVTGSLQGTATLGTFVQGAGGNDALLAKLDPDGKPLWIERFGDPQDQYGSAVTTWLASGQNDVVLVGNFQGSIDFGTTTLVSQGGYDFFVAEFGP
jgi:hypothetical protein